MWIWRFFLPHQYPKVEQWLSDMASQGWRLAEHRRFRFRFEQHEPRKRRFLYMLGSSRENDIQNVVGALKTYCHALEVPSGRLTASTLLMLPEPEKLEEFPEWVQKRCREHLKHFLSWAFAWLVILLPLHAALGSVDSLLRWLGHGLLLLPVLTYLYAACLEVWRK